MNPDNPTSRAAVPTRLDALKFVAKSRLLQLRRGFENVAGRSVRRHQRGSALAARPQIASSKTRLWTETAPEERVLIAGKIQNLRVAVAAIDGVEVAAGETFSFWKQIGRASVARGFVKGRELREGCIIPNIGGGLCQLSNALYDAALKANFEILERHAHTEVIAGSLAEEGRDATVFWNYVDLRFRSAEAFRIEAKLSDSHLSVTFRGTPAEERTRLHGLTRGSIAASGANSCMSCGVNDCFRVVDPASIDLAFGRTSFLVDEFNAEFNKHIGGRRTDRDELMLPIDGKRFRRMNYAWETGGYASVRQTPLVTAVRSYRSRKLAAQGAARQKDLLAMYERLAAAYAARLSFETLHVVVQQNLLPFLWKSGALGGRTFDVLMTALPMAEIQSRLDQAKLAHPESTTLGDFRADAELVDAEAESLAAASRIITTHSAIAELFGERSDLLEVEMPRAVERSSARSGKPRIAFPATTLGRKGCYELRDAVRGMDAKILLFGPTLESSDFWAGFDVEQVDNSALGTADLVVLPAYIEHRPRRLLQAAASGIPVIASAACGVRGVKNITVLDAIDASVLREAIAATGLLRPEIEIA